MESSPRTYTKISTSRFEVRHFESNIQRSVMVMLRISIFRSIDVDLSNICLLSWFIFPCCWRPRSSFTTRSAVFRSQPHPGIMVPSSESTHTRQKQLEISTRPTFSYGRVDVRAPQMLLSYLSTSLSLKNNTEE